MKGRTSPYSLLEMATCRLIEMWVECKYDLNASRALLVLERTILKVRSPYSLVKRSSVGTNESTG